jgi:recombination DNA repair RAD52 pathway protein
MSFTPEQIKALAADLHKAHVKSREQAGRTLDYIEGWHAEAEANRIFGYDAWDTETVYERCVSEKPRKIGRQPNTRDGWSVSYVAKVRVTVTAGDRKIVREGIGAGHGIDADVGLAHESAIKEAATDAEKRALKTFGNPFGLALYDKTRAHVSDAPPPEPPTNGSGRKSSAQAKRDGDHERINTEIAQLDQAGLLDWFTRFDEYTAELPIAWLNPLRDKLELRREELMRPTLDAERDMDEQYAATFRESGVLGVARNGSSVAAA